MTEGGRWQQRWPADMIVLLAGAVLPLAFSPLGWWPLALLSLAILIWFTLISGAGRIFWRGWLFGLGWFGVGVSWVYVSINLFGNSGALFSAGLTALLVMVLSVYPALTVWLTRRLSAGKLNFELLLILPASWVFIEWMRSWLFTGFAWLEPGYAFIDTPLAHLVPITGVSGLTFIVVLAASLIVSLLDKGNSKLNRFLCLGLLLSISGLALLSSPPVFYKADGDTLKVALVQGNIPQDRKWLPEEKQPTLDMYRRQTEKHWDKDIIVWPETAVPAFEDKVPDYLDTMHYAAQLSSTRLLTGIVVRETGSSRYFNAMIVLGNPDRGSASRYKKQHLVPFGEYLPLKFLLGPLLDFLQIPMSDFSPGDKNESLVQAGKYQVGSSICFEAAFGGEILGALPRAHYLVNISNDAWFGDSLAPHQHLQKARMRALETGRYLLRSTNTGISAVIGPDGQIQASSQQFEREVVVANIRPLQGSTPFVRFGYYPILGFSIFILLIAGLRARRQSVA